MSCRGEIPGSLKYSSPLVKRKVPELYILGGTCSSFVDRSSLSSNADALWNRVDFHDGSAQLGTRLRKSRATADILLLEECWAATLKPIVTGAIHITLTISISTNSCAGCTKCVSRLSQSRHGCPRQKNKSSARIDSRLPSILLTSKTLRQSALQACYCPERRIKPLDIECSGLCRTITMVGFGKQNIDVARHRCGKTPSLGVPWRKRSRSRGCSTTDIFRIKFTTCAEIRDIPIPSSYISC